MRPRPEYEVGLAAASLGSKAQIVTRTHDIDDAIRIARAAALKERRRALIREYVGTRCQRLFVQRGDGSFTPLELV